MSLLRLQHMLMIQLPSGFGWIHKIKFEQCFIMQFLLDRCIMPDCLPFFHSMLGVGGHWGLKVVTCMGYSTGTRAFDVVLNGPFVLAEVCSTGFLGLSKNSWSLLVARKTCPVGLSKTSVHLPSFSLYQNGVSPT